MIKHIKFFTFSLLVAIAMAHLEVQIEGSGGWAANLPTWKISTINIFGLVGYNEKPITGYHVYLWLFSFLLTHTAFIFNKWSIKKEFTLLSFYVFFTTFEGVIWFIINPEFGLTKFLNGNISWYTEPFFLYLPIEYWVRFAIGIFLYKLSLNDQEYKFAKFSKS